MSMWGLAWSRTVPPIASVPIVVDWAVPCSMGLSGSVVTCGVAGSIAIATASSTESGGGAPMMPQVDVFRASSRVSSSHTTALGVPVVPPV
jgi:hypothetical protein